MEQSIVTLGVSDLTKSFNFYTDILGFKEDHRFSPAEGQEIVFLENENKMVVELVYNKNLPTPDNSKTSITLTFIVKDLEERKELLNKNEISFTELELPSGVKFLRLKDPDGLNISFGKLK